MLSYLFRTDDQLYARLPRSLVVTPAGERVNITLLRAEIWWEEHLTKPMASRVIGHARAGFHHATARLLRKLGMDINDSIL